MGKRKISITECADTTTKSLEKGVFLTTKAGDKINSMVIGWGHIGRIWERPVFITYVRDCRYTYEMLERNPEFTVNVPINGFDKNAFRICGTQSGRFPGFGNSPSRLNAGCSIRKSRTHQNFLKTSASNFIRSRHQTILLFMVKS